MPNSPSGRRAPKLRDPALDEILSATSPGSLDALADALEPDAEVLGVESAPTARARLLAALETTHRFDDLEAEVADLLDLPLAEAARLLLDVDRPSVWEPGPHAKCQLFHVTGGARVRDAVTGFVRIAPDAGFPEHEHLGPESVLVLQGAFRDAGGRIVRAGELARMPAESSHSFEVFGDLPLLYLAVVQRGVVVGGVLRLAGDPRA